MDGRDILDSEAWKEACKAVETRIIDEFKRTAASETDTLSDLAYKKWALYNIAQELERELKSINTRVSNVRPK